MRTRYFVFRQGVNVFDKTPPGGEPAGRLPEPPAVTRQLEASTNKFVCADGYTQRDLDNGSEPSQNLREAAGRTTARVAPWSIT